MVPIERYGEKSKSLYAFQDLKSHEGTRVRESLDEARNVMSHEKIKSGTYICMYVSMLFQTLQSNRRDGTKTSANLL